MIICITKMDLVTDEELERIVDIIRGYMREMGYPVLLTIICKRSTGMEQIKMPSI